MNQISERTTNPRNQRKTVDGNLEAAEAALGDVQQKLRKGERVAPSRQSFAELYEEWRGQLNLGERTIEHYERDARLHLLPRFGRRRAQELTTDDVARLIVDLQKRGLAGWTIRGVLTCLSSMYAWAVRRGKVPQNPVSRLERGERPAAEGREKRILSRDEIAKLLAAAPEPYCVLLSTGVFSGLRLMELLGLRWIDVDREQGELHVRHQLSRTSELVKLKTNAGRRDVVLMPELGAMLRRHELASAHSKPEDFVFCSAQGRPLHHRNVQRRGMDKAVERAKLDKGKRDPTMHDLRHTFARLLIAQGLDVVYISRQLGHANPATTLRVYASEFDRVRSAKAARTALSAQFGALLDGNAMETAPRYSAQLERPEVAEIRQING